MSEMTAIPFSQLLIKPVHPGIAIGTDLMVKDATAWYRSFGIEAGYYYHKLYEHAIMLDAVYNFGYTFNFGLRFKTIEALGYKHSILTGDTYIIENGEYVKKQHPGQPQVSAKIGLGLEYPVVDNLNITCDYTGMLAFPYSPESGMPYATHAVLRLGIKIQLH